MIPYEQMFFVFDILCTKNQWVFLTIFYGELVKQPV